MASQPRPDRSPGLPLVADLQRQLEHVENRFDRVEQATLAHRAMPETASAADGAVSVVVNGVGQIRALTIMPSAIERLTGPALGKAIVAAVNSARTKAAEGWSKALEEAGSGLASEVSDLLAACGVTTKGGSAPSGADADADVDTGSGAIDPTQWDR